MPIATEPSCFSAAVEKLSGALIIGILGSALCRISWKIVGIWSGGMIVARHCAPADSITEMAGAYDDRLLPVFSILTTLPPLTAMPASTDCSASGVVVP